MVSVRVPSLRVLASYAAVAVLLLVGAVPLLSVQPAAAAVTRTIDITADGPKPANLTAAVGDTIRFRNADATFIHQARAASTNWRFDTGPMAPMQVSAGVKLTKPGTYLYEGANLDTFKGQVVVPAPPSPAASPRRTTAAPKPGSSPSRAASPAASPAAGSPSPTGGSGAAGAPPLTGGFGGGALPSPPPGGPAPNVAPAPPGEPAPSPEAVPSGPVVAAAPGRLPEPATARRYGLPAALAAVAAAGVGSLLVRLLLAHPAARERRSPRAGPAVTVD